MNGIAIGANPTVTSSIDPFSVEYLSDPYPYLEQLRELGPVIWLEKLGVWAVPRHKDVRQVLADSTTYCSGAGVGLANFNNEKPWRPPSLLLEADPPAHTARRTVMGRVLSPGNLRKLKDGFEREAVARIQQALDSGHIEGVTEIAQAYVLKVFPDSVGLAPDSRANLMAYGSMVFNSFGPRNKIFEESVKDADAVSGWVMSSCQRDALDPKGLGEEIYLAVDSGEISAAEAPLLVRSFLSAGVDTTVDAIGNILYAFATFPNEWEKMRANPGRARSAVEEVLRYESPFQTFFRTTTCDVELAGQKINRNQKVMVSVGSANRDPRQWDAPDELNLDRRLVGQLAFGAGIHGCVGQMISRLEAEVFLTTLAQMVRRIELTAPPKRKIHNTLRGFATLPMQLRA